MTVAKRKLIRLLITIGVLIIYFVAAALPRVEFYGEKVRLFTLMRFGNTEGYTANVLGDYVIETEYGTITLKHFSKIWIVDKIVGDIDVKNFRNGLASHKLVIEEMEIPQDVSIAFTSRPSYGISVVALESKQEVVVSGVPLFQNQIRLNDTKLAVADINISGFAFKEDLITLADSTRLSVDKFYGGLLIDKNNNRWKLENDILVKLPGETEFTRYRSITFRPDWGEFIEGELFEE